jgi:hypothetical protein
MIPNVPAYISVLFAATTLATLLGLYLTVNKSRERGNGNRANLIIISLTAWLILQAIFAMRNIYSSATNSLPPKIAVFAVLPVLLVILFILLSTSGKQFIDGLSLKTLTYLHVVRIPVELVLYGLFAYKAVPQLMTFEGRNFDILSGITAPFIAYFGFTKRKLSRQFILVWNFICLALLFNIVINALLSAPSPLQKFAFDQPNVAILYFPFIWLPAFIVPAVLFAHLTAIRQLVRKQPMQGRAAS